MSNQIPNLFARRTFRTLVALLPGLGLIANGCAHTNAIAENAPPKQIARARQEKIAVNPKLVAADNAFGFSLLNRLADREPGKNVFLSPASVALALHMTYNGARGTTQKAMAQTLHLDGLDVATLNSANAALQASLQSTDPKVKFNIANGLWVRDRDEISPAFVSANRDYYGAELGSTKDAPDNVNAWVKAKTQGKIPTILGADDYSAAVAILVNAIYFKGQWTKPFEVEATKNAPFTLENGTKRTCKMMNTFRHVNYLQGNHFQAVSLPYGSGRFAMTLILPEKGVSLAKLRGQLTPESWQTWMSQMKYKEGSIGLPRFRVEFGKDLIPALTALGMGEAFTSSAQFGGLVQKPTAPYYYIQQVQHKTFLDVNETGTEAAAATAVVAMAGAAFNPEKPFSMILDRPFLCAITDTESKAVLFIGAINDPTA